jgi:hypothetical protein
MALDYSQYKSIATWIRQKDFELLCQLSARQKVSVAAYVRGIIVDAIADEATIRPIDNCSLQLDLLSK